jgi:hypothetical protein
MKKFCSKCGTQLDLGKRSCTHCQAFNPYFIAGFVSKSEAGSMQEIVTPTITESAEMEKISNQPLTGHENDLQLKNELLKVKEETEQYKKETLELVSGVKKELQDIERENKLLKAKVELLNANSLSNRDVPGDHDLQQNSFNNRRESRRGVTILAACLLFIVVTGGSWFFFRSFSSTHKNTSSSETTSPPSGNKPVGTIEEKKIGANQAVKDSIPVKKLLAVANTTPVSKPSPVVPSPSTNPVAGTAINNSTPVFTLTEGKVRNDLVGKKLSGCDITINTSAEIHSISNIALVDKLSASYLKYKCIVKVKQGTEVYTSTPYIYYSAEGSFIKIDGTNCE